MTTDSMVPSLLKEDTFQDRVVDFKDNANRIKSRCSRFDFGYQPSAFQAHETNNSVRGNVRWVMINIIDKNSCEKHGLENALPDEKTK